MKILISVDMEGITGVTNWDHVTPGHAEYARYRKLMTEDVNAAIEGAFDAGAKEVVIADGHWNGSNILVEEVDPRGELNSGAPSPLSMMQGINRDVDGVFFIGYHARQGSANAVLDHTWSDTCVANLWLNDAIAGEYTLNAALAGHFGVPVIMVSGDQTACAQVVEQVGVFETAVVKQATGRFSAECFAPDISHKIIYESAKRAVTRLAKIDSPKPFILKSPVRVTVQLVSSDMADRAMHLPGVTRDDLTLSFMAADMPKAYSGLRALVMLSYPR